jgi:hypothetical protein
VALGSNRLDRRGTDAGLGGEHFIESAYPLDIGIAACGIDYPTVAYNVIDDDETATAGQFAREPEILGDALLVGVDEDEIESAVTLGGDLRQNLMAAANPKVDKVRQAGSRDVGARNVCMSWLGLDGDEAALFRQRPGKSDRAVAAERANLQNSPRILKAGQEVQELALVWRNLDGRKARGVARL